MSSRKQTPDVLGELLGGAMGTSGTVPAASAEAVAPKPKKVEKRTTPRPTEVVPSVAASPASSAPATPPQWEYLTVTFRDYRGWRPHIVNGRELSDWKEKPVLHEYLAQLGGEGWELVSLTEPRRYERDAYLKRVK